MSKRDLCEVSFFRYIKCNYSYSLQKLKVNYVKEAVESPEFSEKRILLFFDEITHDYLFKFIISGKLLVEANVYAELGSGDYGCR